MSRWDPEPTMKISIGAIRYGVVPIRACVAGVQMWAAYWRVRQSVGHKVGQRVGFLIAHDWLWPGSGLEQPPCL